jgi:hypothetical protein
MPGEIAMPGAARRGEGHSSQVRPAAIASTRAPGGSQARDIAAAALREGYQLQGAGRGTQRRHETWTLPTPPASFAEGLRPLVVSEFDPGRGLAAVAQLTTPRSWISERAGGSRTLRRWHLPR